MSVLKKTKKKKHFKKFSVLATKNTACEPEAQMQRKVLILQRSV